MTTESATVHQPSSSLLASSIGKNNLSVVYNQWRLLVQEFTACGLTRATDRLPAIAGLADEYGKITGDSYIAGHWLEDLPRSLLWSVLKDGKRAKPYRAPSWSWASIEGHIEHSQYANSTKLVAQVVDHSLTLKGFHVYGEIHDACVTLLGPLYKATVQERLFVQKTIVSLVRSFKANESKNGMTRTDAPELTFTDARFHLDLDNYRDPPADADGNVEIYMLAIGEHEGDLCCGIAITQSSVGADTFRRVGYVEDLPNPKVEQFMLSVVTMV